MSKLPFQFRIVSNVINISFLVLYAFMLYTFMITNVTFTFTSKMKARKVA